MKRLPLLVLATSLVFSIACGGTAVDLDRPASLDGAAGNPAVESMQIGKIDRVLGADGSRVYWDADPTIGSDVRGCAFDRCADSLLSYFDVQTTGSLAVAPDELFFSAGLGAAGVETASNNVLSCPKTGCSDGPETFVQDPDSGDLRQLFTVDTQALYWASEFDIYRCPLAGCGEVPERVASRLDGDQNVGATPQTYSRTSALLVAGDSVYWRAQANVDAAVFWAAKDGSGTAKRLATVSLGDFGFAVDDRRLYWLDDSNQIVSCVLSECGDSAPTPLVATGAPKSWLQVDERGLYWLQTDSYPEPTLVSLRFCPLSGCAAGTEPASLASNHVRSYVLSPSYVYWDESISDTVIVDTGLIYRMPKPAK